MTLVIATAPNEKISFSIDGTDVGAPLDLNGQPSAVISRLVKPAKPAEGAEPADAVADTGWEVKTDGEVVLPLSNLVNSEPVTIQVKIKSVTDTGEGTAQPAIVLSVNKEQSRRSPTPPK